MFLLVVNPNVITTRAVIEEDLSVKTVPNEQVEVMDTLYIENNKSSEICDREVVSFNGASYNWITCVEDTTRTNVVFRDITYF